MMANDLIPDDSEGVESEGMVPKSRIKILRPGGGPSALEQMEQPGPNIPVMRLPGGGPVRLGPAPARPAPVTNELLAPGKSPGVVEVGHGKEIEAGRGAAAQTGARYDESGRPVGPGGGGQGGSAGVLTTPEQAQAKAARAAGAEVPVEGLPQKPIKFKSGNHYVPGPSAVARQAAREYAAGAGHQYNPPTKHVPVDEERAKRIASAFDQMKHDPDNPKVSAAYDAMIKETLAQWQSIKKTGLKVDFLPEGMEDPYGESPRRAMEDIRENNHLWVFPTSSGYGTNDPTERSKNPMLRPSGEVVNGHPAVNNDIFRIVHDYFGHYKEGHGFRAAGEDNAWRSHAAMYSDLARPAMTSETRGQNSWVNFGPHMEFNKTASGADTKYSDQKVGLMPSWTMTDSETGGYPGAGKRKLAAPAPPRSPHLPTGGR